MITPLKRAALPLVLPLLAATLPGAASAEKICKTYWSNGARCTMCYYTNIPESGSTTCVEIQAPSGGSGNSGETRGPKDRIFSLMRK